MLWYFHHNNTLTVIYTTEIRKHFLKWQRTRFCCSLDSFMGTIGSQRLTLKSRQHRQSLSHVSCCDCGLSSLASQSTGWIGLWFLCPEHWPGQRTQPWDQPQGRSWCGGEAQSPSDTAIYGEAWDCIKEGNHSELLSFFYLLLWGRLLWTSAETSSGLWGKKAILLSWCLRASNQEGKVAYNGGVLALLSASQQLLRQRKVTKVAALKHVTSFKGVIMQVTFSEIS